MTKPSGLAALAAAFLLCLAPTAHAEDAEPVFADRGMIGGWDVYSSGSNVFIPSPDGKFFVVGRLFSRTGQDIGAALTASEPSTIPEAVLTYLKSSVLMPVEGYTDCETCARTADQAGIMPGSGTVPPGPAGTAGPSQGTPRLDMPAAATREPPVASTVEHLTGAYGFDVGSGGLPVVMVVDPACPFCTRAVHTLRPAIEQGRILLRVRLVAGYVRPMKASLNMAGAILTAADPAAEFMDFMARRINDPSAAPRAFAQEDLTPEILSGVHDNILLARDLRVRSVPHFAWVDQSGRSRSTAGLPDALKDLAVSR